MMLVEYVRDRKNSKIVDERVEVVHKKNEKGKEKEIKELWVKLEKGLSYWSSSIYRTWNCRMVITTKRRYF